MLKINLRLKLIKVVFSQGLCDFARIFTLPNVNMTDLLLVKVNDGLCNYYKTMQYYMQIRLMPP